MTQFDDPVQANRALAGTCAFTATLLDGIQVDSIAEHGQDRHFSALWVSKGYCCVWDAERGSYVHVESKGDCWRLYDVISNHMFRVDSAGRQYTFTDETSPEWLVSVLLAPHHARVDGPDGEHSFAIK